MGEALATKGHFPGVASKPAPFLGRSADRTTSAGTPKAPDVKQDPLRVGKVMCMTPLVFDLLRHIGNQVIALATEHLAVFFRLGAVFLLTYTPQCFPFRCISGSPQPCSHSRTMRTIVCFHLLPMPGVALPG